MKKILLYCCGGLLALLGSYGAVAETALNVDGNGVAANGYDVVAYFDGNAVEGSSDIEVKYKGALWRFASKENAEEFVDDPDKYIPAYGGYCAYGVSQGYLVATDPHAWTVADDKLYLNFNQPTRSHWLTRQDEYIGVADLNWPGLSGQ